MNTKNFYNMNKAVAEAQVMRLIDAEYSLEEIIAVAKRMANSDDFIKSQIGEDMLTYVQE